jgi:hypothetical protein
MNDATLTGLKVLVERAVRPVRASFARKNRMRQELLAHVGDVFDEEVARDKDEPAALERTARRFGDPAELTGSLQASVPTSDALERFVDWLWYRPGEATVWRALRHGLLVTLGAVLLLGQFLWAVWVRLGGWPPETLVPLTGVVACVFCFGFTVTFLGEGMRRALYGPTGPSWVRASLVSLGSAVLYLPFIALALWVQIGSRVRWTDPLILLFAMGAAIAFLLFPLAHSLSNRLRQHEEWAALPLP